MSRVKLSEYRAKTILYEALGVSYDGVSIDSENYDVKKLDIFFRAYPKAVLKVDQAVKKRNKLGLVKLDVSADNIKRYIREFLDLGYKYLLLEPLVQHRDSDERYFSIELTQDGVRILTSSMGGVDIEKHKDSIEIHDIKNKSDLDSLSIPHLDGKLLKQLVDVFNEQQMTNLEINPYVQLNGSLAFLDAALQVDGSADFFASAWTVSDIRSSEKHTHETEKTVETLASTSPASLSLKVLNEQGEIFMLLSGGGASVVLLDEIAAAGKLASVANYGEYSGNPSRQETYLYTKQVLSLLQGSSAKKKVLLIAGGVANFTDIKKTFEGIIDAMKEFQDALNKDTIMVIIRRGGPNDKEGLARMKEFLDAASINNITYGAEVPLTQAVSETVSFLGLSDV